MKYSTRQIFTLNKISYSLFILLLIIFPFALYRVFDNSLEFVKSEVLKIQGGIFIIVCSAYLILNLYEKKSERTGIIFNKILDPYVLFFAISVVFSAVFSFDFQTSYEGSYERQIGLITYIYLFILYMLLPVIINNSNRLKTAVLIMELTAILVAVMSLMEYLGIKSIDLRPHGFNRPVTTIGHPIFSAGFMVLVFPFSVLNISSKKSTILKLAAPIFIAAGIIATQTRTTYVALGIEIIIISSLYSLTSKEKHLNLKESFIKSIWILLGFLILCLALVLLFPENVFVKRLLSISKLYEQPRWLLWRDSISMFIQYPLTGTGIGNFSKVFEKFASYQLKFSEIKVYFDNAHNNYINTFCTMGLIGGAAYLLILFRVLKVSFKNLVLNKASAAFRIRSLAFLSFISGYIVFGLADFDDINILFYLFIILALFKIVLINYGNKTNSFNTVISNKRIIFPALVILILFSFYGIYGAFGEISAQNSFSEGLEHYSSGNIDAFMDNMNNAVKLNQDEPYYKYEFASKLNIYCSGLTKDYSETKRNLLETAKELVTKAEVNNSSRLNCIALRSLIELELGNEQEGFRIKNELFKIDSIQVPYRINLAVYYLNQNNDSAAIKEINTVLQWDIKNINAFTAKVMYFIKTGNNSEAEETCRKLLIIDPSNSFAERTLMELKQKK